MTTLRWLHNFKEKTMTKPAKKPKTDEKKEVKFSLRVPPDIYEVLQQVAHSEKRSINSQVLLIIERWIESNRPPFGD